MKQRYKSLLETIHNSLKGNDKSWITPSKSDRVPFNRYDVPDKKDIDVKNTNYTFNIQEPTMSYKFTVNIYKWKSFWKGYYACIISISENKQWGSNVEKIGICPDDGYQQELKNIFNLLEERNEKKFKEAESEKVNKYVRDVTLSVDKSLLRDDKISDILS
jgi:hypothetical protein